MIFLLLLIFVPFRWSKDYPKYRVIDMLYNFVVKFRHQYGITPLNKKICFENLFITQDILNKYGVFFWLSEGTALGFRRDNDFIDWDDDVDISINIKDKKKLIKALPELEKHGFKVVLTCFNYKNGHCICLIRNGEKVDIDVVNKDGYCLASDAMCDELIPYLQSFNRIRIKNRIFNIPNDRYLEYLYGKDWKTPLKSKVIHRYTASER